MSQVFSSTTCNARICGHNVVHSNGPNHQAGAAGSQECRHFQCKGSRGGDSKWEESLPSPSVQGTCSTTSTKSDADECLFIVCLQELPQGMCCTLASWGQSFLQTKVVRPCESTSCTFTVDVFR